MKKLFLLITIAIVIISCNLFDSSDDEQKITINSSIDDVIIEIYEDGGALLKIDTLNIGKTEITFDIDSTYYNPPKYYFYAFRSGYYTDLFKSNNNETVDVDLDLTDEAKFCGTAFFNNSEYIYIGQPGIKNFADDILKNQEIIIRDDFSTQEITTFTTNDKGQFAIDKTNLLNKAIYFETSYLDMVYTVYNINSIGYQDLFFYSQMYQVDKPNIYIYPIEETTIDVKLNFLQGGKVIKSIPEYNNGNGWKNLNVKPDGIINDQYEFLFYEASMSDKWQYKNGWVIKKEKLVSFFRQNLTETGFNEKEIEDFVEYWIPRLDKFDYYALYPQYNNEIDKLIELKISQQPDNILRLFYVIDGMNKKINLTEPTIPEFNRTDFVVTEWGGILK